MFAARLFVVLGVFVLAAACDRGAPTGPGSTTTSPASTGPIAFVSDRDGSDQIYLANEDGSAVTRLTEGWTPTWSRDGQRLPPCSFIAPWTSGSISLPTAPPWRSAFFLFFW